MGRWQAKLQKHPEPVLTELTQPPMPTIKGGSVSFVSTPPEHIHESEGQRGPDALRESVAPAPAVKAMPPPAYPRPWDAPHERFMVHLAGCDYCLGPMNRYCDKGQHLRQAYLTACEETPE